ncbi:MAG: rRNA maturation RNase YbeY [Verrucomicrobiota bacterium]
MKKSSPKILLLNRQNSWKTSLPDLKRDIASAMVEVVKSHPFPSTIQEIEVLLVTPSESSNIHQEFFNDPNATDVMTFAADPLASIMICPEIARKQRHEEGLSIYEEVLTYAIHGLLHLTGLDDHSAADFKRMQAEQTRIRLLVHES